MLSLHTSAFIFVTVCNRNGLDPCYPTEYFHPIVFVPYNLYNLLFGEEKRYTFSLYFMRINIEVHKCMLYDDDVVH